MIEQHLKILHPIPQLILVMTYFLACNFQKLMLHDLLLLTKKLLERGLSENFELSLFSIKPKVINTFKYIKRNIKKVSSVYTIQFILKLLIREVSYEVLWFSFALFSIDNEHIHKDFKSLGLLYTIPFLLFWTLWKH